MYDNTHGVLPIRKAHLILCVWNFYYASITLGIIDWLPIWMSSVSSPSKDSLILYDSKSSSQSHCYYPVWLVPTLNHIVRLSNMSLVWPKIPRQTKMPLSGIVFQGPKYHFPGQGLDCFLGSLNSWLHTELHISTEHCFCGVQASSTHNCSSLSPLGPVGWQWVWYVARL